jgi:transcription elongation factor Elf1
MKQSELPDEQVKVVIASCTKCSEVIRVGIEHMMDKKDFYKEVVKYNLSVKTVSLTEYRKGINWCRCK